jgi:hypothetical protein
MKSRGQALLGLCRFLPSAPFPTAPRPLRLDEASCFSALSYAGSEKGFRALGEIVDNMCSGDILRDRIPAIQYTIRQSDTIQTCVSLEYYRLHCFRLRPCTLHPMNHATRRWFRQRGQTTRSDPTTPASLSLRLPLEPKHVSSRRKEKERMTPKTL